MKRISAILAFVLIFAITVIPVSAAEITIGLTSNVETVEIGDTITLTVGYQPSELQVAYTGFKITWNDALVKYVSNSNPTDDDTCLGEPAENNKYDSADIRSKGENYVEIAAGAAANHYKGTILYVQFEALANGKVDFELEITDTTGDYDMYDYEDIATQGTSVTIGSVKEDEFKVTAVEEVDKTVVTVEHAELAGAAGTVYAASYTDGGVLINCAVGQTLANGEITFAGITGNVKVFVWDENNAPLWDTVIEL